MSWIVKMNNWGMLPPPKRIGGMNKCLAREHWET